MFFKKKFNNLQEKVGNLEEKVQNIENNLEDINKKLELRNSESNVNDEKNKVNSTWKDIFWTFMYFLVIFIIFIIFIFFKNKFIAIIVPIIVFFLCLLILMWWEYDNNTLYRDINNKKNKWINKESVFFNLLKEYFIIFKKYIINHVWYTILFLSFLSLTIFFIVLRIKWIEIQIDKHFFPLWVMIFLWLLLTASDTDFTKRSINTTIWVIWFSVIPLFISILYLFSHFYDNSLPQPNNKIILSNNKLDWGIAWIKLNNLSWSDKDLEKIYSDTLNSSYVSTYTTGHMLFSSFLTILLFTITIIFLKQTIKTNNQKKEVLNKLEKIGLYIELTNNNYKENKDLVEELKKEIEKDIQIFIPQFPIDNDTKYLDQLTEKTLNMINKKNSS